MPQHGETVEMGLLSLLEKLTGDERVDNAVGRYCKHAVSEWDKAWTGQESALEKLRLAHYVPARFSVELTPKEREERTKKAPEPEKESRHQEKLNLFEPVEGEREEDVFDKLMNLGKGRLCVSEGPGAGKSVFSRRLQAYLCTREAQEKHFDGRPALVVRWEESPDRNGVPLPEDFEEGFAVELAPHLEKGVKAGEVVSQLLRENRIVLILDALDQVTKASEAAFNKFFLRLGIHDGGNSPLHCQFIVTSRPYADAMVRERRDASWRMARIERFNVRQQYAYLFGRVAALAPVAGEWLDRQIQSSEPALISAARFRENATRGDVEKALRTAIRSLIPAQEDDDPIVSSPQGLFLIREWCAAQKLKSSRQHVSFRSLGDLYRQVCRDSLERAYQNTMKNKRKVDSEILDWLEGMLSSMAMQMLVTDANRFSFGQELGDDISVLRTKARERFTSPRPRLPKALFREDSDWGIVFKVSQLTNRLTGVVSDESSLSWPDPRMKEYYAARHLVKNQQSNWINRTEPDALACGDADLQKNFAHPQWSNVWSIAFDLAEAGQCDEERFAAAARHLFDEVRQPRPRKNQPQETWTRPIKLMYRAWGIFQETENEDLQSEGAKILASFHDQFTQILTDPKNPKVHIAAQLVPFQRLEAMVDSGQLTSEQLNQLRKAQPQEYRQRLPLEKCFVECPATG